MAQLQLMLIHVMSCFLHTARMRMPVWHAACGPLAHDSSGSPAVVVALSYADLLQGCCAGLSALAAHRSTSSCLRWLLPGWISDGPANVQNSCYKTASIPCSCVARTWIAHQKHTLASESAINDVLGLLRKLANAVASSIMNTV